MFSVSVYTFVLLSVIWVLAYQAILHKMSYSVVLFSCVYLGSSTGVFTSSTPEEGSSLCICNSDLVHVLRLRVRSLLLVHC